MLLKESWVGGSFLSGETVTDSFWGVYETVGLFYTVGTTVDFLVCDSPFCIPVDSPCSHFVAFWTPSDPRIFAFRVFAFWTPSPPAFSRFRVLDPAALWILRIFAFLRFG